jgi:predicted GNAT family acetyltransferase
MPVVRHTDPAAFLAAAQPVLSRSAEATAAFTAWATALAAQNGRESSYLATYADGANFGAALRRGDGPVVFEDSDPPAAQAFARDLAPAAPKLQGAVGSLPACEAFARAWREATGRVHTLRFHLRHHQLTEVATVPSARGAARIAVEADADWLVESQYAFLAEAGVPDNPERILTAIPKRAARGEFWIWDVDGAPVAFAGWSDAGDDAARVAPVYTLPVARCHGYATALVAALAQSLLDRRKARVFLVTDVANATSNAIYARIGFRPATDVYHFDFVDPA